MLKDPVYINELHSYILTEIKFKFILDVHFWC